MTAPIQFPFVIVDPAVGAASLSPILPVQLSLDNIVSADALLDTGATVNVLPYSLGLQLGAEWDRQTAAVRLTGNLANVDARVLIAMAQIGAFAPARLVFAWAESDDVPLLFGQVNFFVEFDVCFFRARSLFEVRPAQP